MRFFFFRNKYGLDRTLVGGITLSKKQLCVTINKNTLVRGVKSFRQAGPFSYYMGLKFHLGVPSSFN